MKDFLEVSCGLSDFVERYRGLYVRLKRAMEELFGQQTAFALALRTGFSSALLQLSILRAVHVSPPQSVHVSPPQGIARESFLEHARDSSLERARESYLGCPRESC